MTVPVFNIVDTWNDSGTTFTAIKMNVTNTASAAASMLMDLQVGSASKLNVTKDGRVHITDTSDGVVMYSLYNNSNTGLGSSASVGGAVAIYANGTQSMWISNNTITLGDAGGSGVVQIPGSSDVWRLTFDGSNGPTLHWDAAGILGIRQGTVAQSVRVYNTYTDSSNYERGIIDWGTTSNVLTIGTQAAGTGTLRAVKLIGSDITVQGNTATPAGGSTSARLLFGTTAGFGIYYGSGAPTVSAAAGSLYIRTDNAGANLRLYSNTTGSTTWAAITSA